ncbi:MAG: FMN-binding protein [Actinobacteria bacterium]|nr:FMN-binding protein [Actinomycetota bacterium]
MTQSSPDLASNTTESQSSPNPPLTLSGNGDKSGNDDESYSTQTSQSSINQSPAAAETTTSTTTAAATTTNTTTAATTVADGLYKNGQYDGGIADAYYGNVQVKAIIQGGKLADVQFLSYPSDRRYSVEVNTYALPILKSEAIQAQSAQVDTVSGATNTSNAFINSLSSALSQAKV